MTNESPEQTMPPEETPSVASSSSTPSSSGSPIEPTSEQESPATEESNREPDGAASVKGVPKFKIGSQREQDGGRGARPKPTKAKGGPEPRPAPESTKSKYPAPNIRAQLPPELEAEVEAALGGESLDALLGGSPAAAADEELEAESRVEGRVVKVHRDDVFFDLGGRNQGLATLKQFDEVPEVGTTMEVVVNRLNPEEGLYEVSVPGASVNVGDWNSVSEGLVVDAMVTGHNKGGLDCEVGSLRGFMPVSQISLYRVEDLEEFVGQKFTCVVTEANRAKRNLVLSRRAMLEREKAAAKEKLLQNLAAGQEYEGTVTSLQPFGAFVDIGGVDGLIHISKLSWERIDHASEVLAVGQKVNVTVEKYDEETGKVGLAYRDLAESPWKNADAKYPATSQVSGTVSKIMDFGAFVKLEPGVEGLIHISEISHSRVHRVAGVLREGQEVRVQVLSVDPDAQRMSLSMKALEARPESAKKDSAAEVEEDLPKGPRIKPEDLQGGLGHGAGGERFGLKW